MSEPSPPRGRVLVIGGSDSSGGAGVQADIKTITAMGGYAASALTALTAQNTRDVFGVVPVDPKFVALQIQAVLEDIGAEAVKTGMLATTEVVHAITDCLKARRRRLPLVVDPVSSATTGTPLIDADGTKTMVRELFPLAAVVTPNAPEAAALTGVEVQNLEGMQHAADRLLLMGPEAVLVKGGHLEGDTIVDLLRTADGVERRFESERVETKAGHGTGCTLASAIAVGLAEGMTLEGAVQDARDFTLDALRAAPGYGGGRGPLNHACRATRGG